MVYGQSIMKPLRKGAAVLAAVMNEGNSKLPTCTDANIDAIDDI